MQVRIVELRCYPIKGCAGVPVDRTRIELAGLTHDREFMAVAAADGGFLSQRKHPVLATIRPELRHDGTKLAVTAPGAGELLIPVLPDGPLRPVTVHSWQGAGADQGADAAEWFSEVVGAAARLVRVPPERNRTRDGRYPSRTGFADAYPLLIASASSLDALNDRILERGAEPVPMDRFRPNIVVGGWPEPHTEDRVDRMRAGDVEVGFTKKCKRCSVPLVDQACGRKAGPEPIRTLADYRREQDGGVTFGANYAVLAPGQVAVGDAVMVHSWAV
ncbi:MAG: MOSC domain-containing protein [Haloechinothrix sp.]